MSIVRSLHTRVMQKQHLFAIAVTTAVVLALIRTTTGQSNGTIARIDTGLIEGVAADGVLSFKGVPYAAPPLGRFRWRRPQFATPWQGVRQASAFGAECLQKPMPGDPAASARAFDEDCLFLNVWRPAADSGEALPVLVWIHGGGFLTGGSSAPVFDGSVLARQGLVVVSMNYRLGRLGFFMHPALTSTGEAEPGNYGFLDQLAALQWVRRNIEAFGGDHRQVTIAGESAGGISVMHFLTWSPARSLFARAVVMSGGGRTYLIANTGATTFASAERAGLAFARSVGIMGTDASTLAALRALPAARISSDLGIEALTTKPDTYAGGPILDGTVVITMPGHVLQRHAAANVPILIGTTSDDLPVLFPPKTNPLSFFGANAPAAKAVYFTDHADMTTAINKIAVDMTMHEPARFVARQMTAAGQPAWLYRFGYVAESLRPKTAGAAQATELPYLFGTLNARYGRTATPNDRKMADTFMGYVAAFARTGDPNRSGLPPWPRYDTGNSKLMMFTTDGDAIVQADPWKARLDMIEYAVESRTSTTTFP